MTQRFKAGDEVTFEQACVVLGENDADILNSKGVILVRFTADNVVARKTAPRTMKEKFKELAAKRGHYDDRELIEAMLNIHIEA